MKSGSARQPPKTYIYGEQLRFLKKTTESRPTNDSLSAECDKPSRASDDVTSEFVPDDSNSSVVDKSTDSPNGLGANFKKPAQVDKRKKRKVDTVELELLTAIKKTPDRHTSFFRGITPTLEGFDDDEVVEFQLKVMQTIYEIKNRKKMGKGSSVSQTTISQPFSDQPGTFTSTPSTSTAEQYYNLQTPLNDSQRGNNLSLVNYYETVGSFSSPHSDSSSMDSYDFN